MAAAMIDAAPVGLFALDAAGSVLVWNATAAELTGLAAERVLGRNGFGAQRATDAVVDTDVAASVMAQLSAGRRVEGRFPAAVPSGRVLWFRAVPRTGPGPAVVGVLRDLSESRVGDEAFALLDALWETAPVGLAYFDTELRYRRVNKAVATIDGGTADDRIGRTLEEAHGETGARITALLREVLADGRPRLRTRMTGRLWHGRGPEKSWTIDAYPVRDEGGAVMGVGLVVIDVTDADRTREELADVAAQRQRLLTRYQSLVEATSAAVWIRAADGSAVEDSPSMRAITGQRREEYLGWGFLDAVHPADRPSKRAAWLDAVATGHRFSHTARLRGAHAGYRWHRARAVAVRDETGAVVEWVGTESDIDASVRARQRLDVLARATLAVNGADDPEGGLTALAETVVPEYADLCRVYLVEPVTAGGAVLTGVRSVSRTAPGFAPPPPAVDRFVFGAAHPVSRAVRDRTAVLDSATTSREEWAGTAEMWDWGRAAGLHSCLAAPVVSGGLVVAAVMFLACGDRPAYTDDDRALVVELAARVSAAVEVTRRVQRTREVSLALQNAMLTEPPRPAEIGIAGLEVQARYLPAAAELQIGGDWYDAFRLPGGDLALAVGDVSGHDLTAAATMGQLRSMLRALAYDTEREPSDVVARLDRVASRLGVTGFTTLVYGRVLWTGDHAVFRWSSAGHPPPLLVAPGGDVRVLDVPVDVVIGVDAGMPRHDHEVALPPGSTLLLYTDGLYERRDDPDDAATDALLRLAGAASELPLDRFCDAVVRGSTADTGDDVVVLAVRAGPPDQQGTDQQGTDQQGTDQQGTGRQLTDQQVTADRQAAQASSRSA
ncbi:SpoIIE family protein phosphatase [Pseudonocardia dioxanivorans]|uniref:SpoIIE family protein phosphatase n=1 Tax=Pseudonocardia dioxanivorans TaxID=240495 RepID=UPI000CCFE97D|nr:SpoIIE family protein phosphatase [Pseudonocardia dioxanivorans]